MFITVDWPLLKPTRARRGRGQVLPNTASDTPASARVKPGETVPRETLWRTKGEAG